ncbi:MAG TPA: hypothetical protein VFT53_05170 [Candidatus Saccharimonadales bacterium]|nr:hypothetical protein [Candidatus Saccharimonadales bacterium]
MKKELTNAGVPLASNQCKGGAKQLPARSAGCVCHAAVAIA